MMSGFAEYAVRVNQVGGAPQILDLTTSVESLEWRHDEDRIGEATVRLGDIPADCCERLSMVRPWLHELRIERNGATVFEGPVSQPFVAPREGGRTEIEAGDMALWLTRRFARVPRNYTATGVGATAVSTIVSQIVGDAMTLADPNFMPFLEVRNCPTLHERIVEAAPPHELAWPDHLQEIVGSLMHMSVHGRQVSFYCIDECYASGPAMNDGDFVEVPVLVRNPDDFATSVAVIGVEDSAPIFGTAGGVNAIGLLVETAIELPGYADVASASAAAASYVTPDAPWSAFDGDQDARWTIGCNSQWYPAFHKLRPGVCLNITIAGCVGVSFDARVLSVGATVARGVERPFVRVKQLV